MVKMNFETSRNLPDSTVIEVEEEHEIIHGIWHRLIAAVVIVSALYLMTHLPCFVGIRRSFFPFFFS